MTETDTLAQALRLAAAGRLPESRTLTEAICRAEPDNTDAWLLLANIDGHRGDFGQAEQSLRVAIRQQPLNAAGHYQLAAALKGQNRLDEAIDSYRTALHLQPTLGRIHNDLGVALQEQGRLHEAIDCYREAIRYQPEYAIAHYNLGNLLRDRGDLDEALACFRRAGELRPDLEDAIAAEAGVLMLQGERDRARRRVRPFIDAGSRNAFMVSQFAELSRHGPEADRIKALDRVLELLERTDPAGDESARLHFSAGNLFADREDHELAFEHYLKANTLKHRPSVARRGIRLISAVQTFFSRERLDALPRASIISGRPVFIVGMPRSGTSLVEQVLASHPAVFGAGELIDINRIANTLQATLQTPEPYPACIEHLTRTTADELATRYLQHLATLSPHADRVTDKMPHNFLNLGLIDILFPGARVIHCRRDPMDTCLSCFTHDLTGSHAYSYDLTTLGEYYSAYRELMRHWRRVLRIPILDIDYETLVAEQDKGTRILLDFCGLDWDDRCLRFHESARVAVTASYDQVRRPLYDTSIGKWKHYERQLQPLADSLASTASAQDTG